VAWIYIEALIIVFAAEVNAVWRRRLYPRALLTPFTDDVDLTEHDPRRAYASYAQSEQFKRQERVHVTFQETPQPTNTTSTPAPPSDEAP